MRAAVIFDMNGVIIESENDWYEVRREYSARWGGHWTVEDQRAVMGDNPRQWAAYMRTRFSVPCGDDEIIAGVVALLLGRYEREVPLLPGARGAVRGLARAFRLGLASSAPPSVIRHVLHAADLADVFSAWISAADVEQGKPAPDVYMKACDRLGVPRDRAVAVEDSPHGIMSAVRAGLRVIAVPNRQFPPPPESLEQADRVVESLTDIDVHLVEEVLGPAS